MRVKFIPEVETAISKLITHTLGLRKTNRATLKMKKDWLNERLETYKTFVVEIESLKDQWHEVGTRTSAQPDKVDSLADKTNQLLERSDGSMKNAEAELRPL